MDVNKEKCKTLKQIRKKMADALNIDLHQQECTYEGKCSGTCPKCRQEEQQLNQAILTKTALAAGMVTMTVGLSGCTPAARGVTEGAVPVLIERAVTESQLEGDVVELPPPEEGVLEGDEYILPEDSEENTTEDAGEGTTATEDEMYELEGDVVLDPSAVD